MSLYRVQHQDGESTANTATNPIAAAHDIVAYLYAKSINPNLINTRRAHPDDRIICVDEGTDFRLGDIVQHPFDIFLEQ